jgi:hypothetical protein
LRELLRQRGGHVVDDRRAFAAAEQCCQQPRLLDTVDDVVAVAVEETADVAGEE